MRSYFVRAVVQTQQKAVGEPVPVPAVVLDLMFRRESLLNEALFYLELVNVVDALLVPRVHQNQQHKGPERSKEYVNVFGLGWVKVGR